MWLPAVRPRVTGGHFCLTLTWLLLCYGTYTGALVCFECEATADKEHENCFVNTMALANGTTRGQYAIDCTASNANWTRCMTLKVEKGGQTLLFLRGCHDGATFEPQVHSDVFLNLPANNQTVCAMVGALTDYTAGCYTSCQTDFCNGPQLIPETNCTGEGDDDESCRAPGIFVGTELLVLLTLVLLVQWFLLRGQ
ncbi:hypothetical protein BsWGS_26399 [Bradybaena similaris]